MQSGVYRDRVSILAAPVETSDGHDGLTEAVAVTTHARWSAKVRDLTGRELERARQIDPRIGVEVCFRYWRAYRDDLDAGRSSLVFHPTSDSLNDRALVIVTPPTQRVPREEVVVLCREAV
jgi:head-tail adaptor